MTRLPLFKKLVVLGILIASSYTLQAGTLKAESGKKRVGLIELYTSEGCSSCPPADRWLSSLVDESGLWNSYIPIALHVDYWDYIGWKDRFASKSYSQRQRKYARENSLKTVYTPGFLYNGEEWRGWFKRRFMDFPDSTDSGVLQLEVMNEDVSIHFDPLGIAEQPSRVHVAVLGFDVKTRVEAGENHGKTLTHNFVVLGLDDARLEKDGKHFSASLKLPEARIKSERYAVVAWVSSANRQAPIQSVGGWLHND